MKIGKDEFCLNCMEWREYDSEGRCKVCKHIICRNTEKKQKVGYDEYNSESPSYETDENIEDEEY